MKMNFSAPILWISSSMNRYAVSIVSQQGCSVSGQRGNTWIDCVAIACGDKAQHCCVWTYKNINNWWIHSSHSLQLDPFFGKKDSMLHKVLLNRCTNSILDVENSTLTDTQDMLLSVGNAISRDALVSGRSHPTHKEDPRSIDRSSTTVKYYLSACKTASIHKSEAPRD